MRLYLYIFMFIASLSLNARDQINVGLLGKYEFSSPNSINAIFVDDIANIGLVRYQVKTHLIDLTNKNHPFFLDIINGSVFELSGTNAFANSANNIYLLDVSNRKFETKSTYLLDEVEWDISSMKRVGNYLFIIQSSELISSHSLLTIIDISDMKSPSKLSSVLLNDVVHYPKIIISSDSNYMFLTTYNYKLNESKLFKYDIRNKLAISLVEAKVIAQNKDILGSVYH